MADVVVLKERVEIDPDNPIPEFDLPNAKAFSAVARQEGGVAMIAYVCDPNIPLRFEAVENMRNYAGPGLIRFVEWGVVFWAPRRRRLMGSSMKCRPVVRSCGRTKPAWSRSAKTA